MSRSEQEEAELRRLLGDLAVGPKFRVAIRRFTPEWCSGYLGTIEVYDREDVGLDSIRDEFGGGKLGLKFMGQGGCYLAHKTIKICGEPLEDGLPIPHDRVRGNPAQSRPVRDDEARDEIAVLRKQLAALEDRVEDLEGQAKRHERRQHEAEELARKALALAEEGEEETPQEHLDRTLAELREKRAERASQGRLMILGLAIAAVLLQNG